MVSDVIYLTLICVLGLCLLPLVMSECRTSGKRVPATDAIVLDTLSLYGPIQCQRECDRRLNCHYIQYDTVHLRCSLMAPTRTDPAPTKPETTFAGPCASLTCPTNSECIEFTNIPPRCIIVGCNTPPATVGNASYTLSKTVYRILEEVMYTCVAGMAIMSGHGKVTCRPDGAWTLPDFLCEVVCSFPLHIPNTSMAWTRTVGSTATYMCNSKAVLVTGVSPLVVVCSSAGAWENYLPFECKRLCPDPYIPYTVMTGGPGTTEGANRTYTCDVGAVLLSGISPLKVTCTAQGTWESDGTNDTIRCDRCNEYGSTFTHRTGWFFNPPVRPIYSYTDMVTVNTSMDACRTRTDFVCVAFYYKNSTGDACILRPMRVHDDPDYRKYDAPNGEYDEYIRDCQ